LQENSPRARDLADRTPFKEEHVKRLDFTSAAVAVAIATVGVLHVDAASQAGSGGPARPQSDTARPKEGTAGPGAQSQGAASSDAREFINHMAIAGLAEVQLGEMASKQASSPDVKAFGQMMVKDHSQANKELARVASQLNVQLPTDLDEKHNSLKTKLSNLQGAEFDREYMNAMVEGHQDVASQLRAQAGNRMTSKPPAGAESPTGEPGANPGSQGTSKPSTSGPGTMGTTGANPAEAQLTQWASKTLPTVQKHLERARQLQQKAK
jgi:putative membrane protein